mmetsp:Transcript_26437/g.78511  ORF Transcript_26437/g.78511 Transcript_26437/m.78511 type:complete len:251 (-) Transcript_26437:178-930(-)
MRVLEPAAHWSHWALRHGCVAGRSAPASAKAQVEPTSAASGRHLVAWYRRLDLNLLVGYTLHMSCCKRRTHALLVGKRDEAKAARALVVVVVHDHRVLHLAVGLEVLAQHGVVDRRCKAADENLAAFAARRRRGATAAAPDRRARPAFAAARRLILLRHRLLRLHLAAVDGMRRRDDLVCDFSRLKHHEAEAARPAVVPVVRHERLAHDAVVLEVGAQLLACRLPGQAAYEHFAGLPERPRGAGVGCGAT